MNEFIEKSLLENQIDIIETIEESKNLYLNTLNRYLAQGTSLSLCDGLSKTRLNALIRYTVDGLTKDQLHTNSFQPEMLYEQICDYLDTIKLLATHT